MKTDTGPHFRAPRSVGALARYMESNKLVGLMSLPQQQLDLIEAEAMQPGATWDAERSARIHAIRWLRDLTRGQLVLLCAKLRIKVS